MATVKAPKGLSIYRTHPSGMLSEAKGCGFHQFCFVSSVRSWHMLAPVKYGLVFSRRHQFLHNVEAFRRRLLAGEEFSEEELKWPGAQRIQLT